MKVALLGNLEPPFSTESEYLDAYQRNGVNVIPFQGDQMEAMIELIRLLESSDAPDFVHWTRTRQHSQKVGHTILWEMLRIAGRHSVPVVGVHLDQFFALDERVDQIKVDPYFRGLDLLMTADGGNQDRWAEMNVEHEWLLPGVSERWVGLGDHLGQYETDIVFTGSWQGGYHPSFAHRHELVERLVASYGDRVRFYPKRGQHAIRGWELNHVYRSAKVVIGDAFHEPGSGGAPLKRTGSDRSPETLGRGGILVTPLVEGWNDPGGPFDTPATFTWEMWDWKRFAEVVEEALDAADRGVRRDAAVSHIAAAHTYTIRVQQVVDIMHARSLL